MRRILLALAVLASLAAHAADRKIAVLSFVGDRLLITQYGGSTAGRLDHNTRQVVTLEDDALDRAALRAVKAAAAKSSPADGLELMAVSSAELAAKARAAADEGGPRALVPLLRKELEGAAATHWILVTRHKAEGRAQLARSSTGSGNFEGRGFYLDRDKRVVNTRTGAHATGILSPFAYLKFTLVDAATGEVVREAPATVSTTVGAQSATHPWDELSAKDKVVVLEQLIRRAADEEVPKLLAP